MNGQTWLWTPPGPAPANANIGQLLKAYRRTHGLTQQQLADLLGFDQSYVSKVESGRRAIHDVSTLRHIGRHLGLPPEDVGLAPGMLERRIPTGEPDAAGEQVADSQRTWRLTRDHLNHHRISLARAAARLYPETYRIGDGLLTRPGWMLSRPIDIDDVELNWTDSVPSPSVTGAEEEAIDCRPMTGSGTHPHYTRYTRAMRDLDRPKLFENRLSFRLTALDRAEAGDRPRLTFGHTTYFDAVDVCETVAHETAAAMMSGALDGLRRRDHSLPGSSLPGSGEAHPAGSLSSHALPSHALPFRRLVGDPFDLARRVTLPSINTLTIRHDGAGASFMLHRRSAGSVATAGGVYHVIPAGVFQPSGITFSHHRADFDLWHNIMRELSEELLGNPDHDGSASAAVDYDDSEPFRSFEQARRSGALRVWYFGVAVDALTLFAEIITVVVVEAEVFDQLFANMVGANAEGAVVTTGPDRPASEGIPFTAAALRRLVETEPLAPSAAACLDLAWRHRETLVPGLRLRAMS